MKQAMQKKHAAILAGVLVLAGGGVAVGLLVKKAKSKKTATPASSATSATTPSNTPSSSTGTSNTAVTSTPLLPPMTDDQAKTWAANLLTYNNVQRNATQAGMDAAVLALYPLMNLSMTGPQMGANKTVPADANTRKYLTRDYTAIQAGGHAAM